MTKVADHLIGRAAELEAIDRALGELCDGRTAPLVIQGEPGIGKTRLLAELAKRADARGCTVLGGAAARGRCTRARRPRSASSASSRVLPIPGSPRITSGDGRPSHELAEGAIDRCQFRGAPDEVVGDLGHDGSCAAEHNPGREIRVRDRGARPMSRARRRREARRMPRFLIHHRHEPQRVRRRVRLLQGPRQPAPPPPGAGLVPGRRPRDLVDRRGRRRARTRCGCCRSSSRSAPRSRGWPRS